MTKEDAWPAPQALKPIQARVEIPGSKSLSNRYLILAGLGARPTRLCGLLRSRDTDLMMAALKDLGVTCQINPDRPTEVLVEPPVNGRFRGGATIDCGLAGTVMRFVPALAMLADGPTFFDGDHQAYDRPMEPLLDGLSQLGAQIEYRGRRGFLPFLLRPPKQLRGGEVRIDSSASSQFISGLLLLGARSEGNLTIIHQGKHLPSLPHIAMTVADLREAGICVQVDLDHYSWTVQAGTSGIVQLPSIVQIEPDLSNAAPFLGAALIGGGSVSVPHWPSKTTQPGGLLPAYLEGMGARLEMEPEEGGSSICTIRGDQKIRGLGDLDLSAAGEIAPSMAAILVFAQAPTRIHGIAHLRGHETNRLEALVKEITRVGGRARELDDGICIQPVPLHTMHGALMDTYADHRMATFAAMLGLKIPGIYVRNIATTAKTLPDFTGMWSRMLGQDGESPETGSEGIRGSDD